jgi:hypothetical protein
MDNPTMDQQIEFLICREFPLYTVARALASAHRAPGQRHLESALVPPSDGIISELLDKDLENVLEMASAFEAGLRAKPASEIDALYRAETTRAQEEQKEAQEQAKAKGESEKAKAEFEESQRIFNKPHAEADFSHWSKAAYWTLDEAIALCFGKNPEIVNWKSVSPYTHISPFAKKFEKARDLAQRAKSFNQLLHDPIIPGFFLAWARRNDIEIPAELLGIMTGDWKDAYDKLKVQYDEKLRKANHEHEEILRKANQEIAKGNDAIAKYQEQRSSLRSEIEELKKRLADAVREPDEQPLTTRERKTAQKLIIGMAVEGYKYDPEAARSDTVREIANDLEKIGLTIHEDTVRDWLRESAKLLPPKPRKT